MRAFNAAKDAVKKKKTGKVYDDDDYVSREEFRFLLLYIRQYYEYWVAFQRLDVDNDHKVSLLEFIAAKETMAKWGIHLDNPEETFKEIDTNGGGGIIFLEFVDWAIKKNLDIDDDDDLL